MFRLVRMNLYAEPGISVHDGTIKATTKRNQRGRGSTAEVTKVLVLKSWQRLALAQSEDWLSSYALKRTTAPHLLAGQVVISPWSRRYVVDSTPTEVRAQNAIYFPPFWEHSGVAVSWLPPCLLMVGKSNLGQMPHSPAGGLALLGRHTSTKTATSHVQAFFYTGQNCQTH